MYFWKCWRGTRVKFFASFVVVFIIILLFVSAIHGQNLQKPGRAQGLLQMAFLMPSGLLLFVGWILSKENPGADIGKGYGDFLMTRPSSRGRIAWVGWATGMIESIVLWIVLSAIAYGALLFRLQQLGVPVSSSARMVAFPEQVFPIFAMFLLDLGLIYGLAYCIGTITRSGSWAVLGSGIVVFAYSLMRSLLLHLSNVHLPELFFHVRSHHNSIVTPSTLAFAIHACLFVAFPLVAHYALQRMEVHK